MQLSNVDHWLAVVAQADVEQGASLPFPAMAADERAAQQLARLGLDEDSIHKVMDYVRASCPIFAQ